VRPNAHTNGGGNKGREGGVDGKRREEGRKGSEGEKA